MADPENGGQIVLTEQHTSQYIITRTMPDELLRHDISDEELDMLSELRRDNAWEGMWVAVGTALGAISSAISALADYLQQTTPRTLSLIDLAQIVVFFGAAAVAIVLALMVWRKSAMHKPLVAQIRERTKRIKGD